MLKHVLEHESDNISQTRKGRGKFTMEGLLELTNALSNGTIPDPLRPPLPQDWGFASSQPPPKNPKPPIAIISRMGEQTSNLARNSQGRSEQKPIKISEKRQRGRIHGLPNFLDTPIITGRGKATNLNFVRVFIASIGRKAH